MQITRESSRALARPKSLRSARHVLKAALCILAVLLVTEASVRVFARTAAARYVVDPVWGGRVAGGQSVVWNTEGHGVTHYVADGEIATPYHDGAGVVVLGDSHTEAWQVNDDQKFVSIAEQRLRQDGYQADLHNLGLSGNSVADYVYLAPYVIRQYAPKLLVIQLTDANFGATAFDSSHTNYFMTTPDGQLSVAHHVDSGSSARWLKRSVALLDYGFTRYQELRTAAGRGATASISADLPGAAVTTDVENREIAALRAAYAGTPLVILMLPFTPYVDNTGLVTTDPPYSSLVARLAQVPGWTVVDPLQAFDHLAAQGQLPRGFDNSVIGTGHLNAAGHQLVGRMLAQTLEKDWR